MKRSKAILCILMISCLVAVNSFNFIGPSYAHTNYSSTWSGRIAEHEQAEEGGGGYLIVEGGQTVLLGEVDGEIRIPLDTPDDGIITTDVNNKSWARSEIQQGDDGAVLVIKSPMYIEVELPPQDVSEEEQPADDTSSEKTGEESGEKTDGPQEDGESDTQPEGTEGSAETEPAAEKASLEGALTEETGNAAEKEDSTSQTGKEGTSSEETGDQGGTGTDPDKENDSQQTDGENNTSSGETGGNEGTETIPDGEAPTEEEPVSVPAEPEKIIEIRPNHVQVTVTWTNSEENRSAIFDLSRTTGFASGDIVIDDELKYYNPAIPIVLQTETQADILFNDGDFPALTRYSIGEEKYLLYNPDILHLPANSAVVLDFSLTMMDDLSITISGNTHTTLTYFDLPVVAVDEIPIVMGDNALRIPAPYTWGSVEPDVIIERMEMAEDGLEWVKDESILCTGDNRELQMTPSETIAGTYRVSIVWKNDITEFYRIEFPFYVFYENGLDFPEVTTYQYVSLV